MLELHRDRDAGHHVIHRRHGRRLYHVSLSRPCGRRRWQPRRLFEYRDGDDAGSSGYAGTWGTRHADGDDRQPVSDQSGLGAATDNIGVTGYRVERCAGVSCSNFAQIATPATTSYADATAAASTTYSYRVRAVDAAGNLGAYSNIATATTPAVPDTQAPGAPGTLTATATSPSQINLGWGAATDNVGVTGYRVERCAGAGCTTFTQIATAPGTTYIDVSSSAATTYVYRVRAVDAAGNLGPYSNTASATTPSAGLGLVAAYGFSEGTGTTTLDGTGNGNLGAITGAAWTNLGRFGNALGFTGSHIVTVNDANMLDLTNGMTLEAWVYPTAPPADWSSLVVKEQPGELVYGLYSGMPGNNRPTGWGFVSVATGVYGTSALPTNTWTHLATTFDGTTLRLFVNGVQTATQPLSGNLRVSTGALRIGGNAVWGEYFRGMIDEVRIYNRALDALAIQSDMSTPVDAHGPDTTAPQAPGTLTAFAPLSNRVDLSWGAATDDVGVASYRIERCTGPNCSTFAQVQTTAITTYIDTTVAATTTYVYRVRAVDPAGNLGPYSATASVTTPVVGGGVTQGLSARWRCNLPGCTSPDWVAAAVNWPSSSAYSTNARTGTNSRTVYSDTGELMYPVHGSVGDWLPRDSRVQSGLDHRMEARKQHLA